MVPLKPVMTTFILLGFLSTIFAYARVFGPGSQSSNSCNVTPNPVPTSGTNITVSWQLASSPPPNTTLVLALFCPTDAADPIGWRNIQVRCDSGCSGKEVLPVVNYRTPCAFRVQALPCPSYEGCSFPFNEAVTLATTSIQFQDPAEVTSTHISIGSRPGMYRVMFQSGDASCKPSVAVGTSPNALTQTFNGTTFAYSAKDLCVSPAIDDPLLQTVPMITHDVEIGPLPGVQRIYYKAVCGKRESGLKDFITFPEAGYGVSCTSEACQQDEKGHVEGFLFGDMGTWVPFDTAHFAQYPAIKTTHWMTQDVLNNPNQPHAVFHIGDISYARGYSFFWQYFFWQIETLASKVPYQVGIGNHEYDYPGMEWSGFPAGAIGTGDSGGECGIPYFAHFHMPGPSYPRNGTSGGTTAIQERNLWYSWNYGPVHFVLISTEHDFLEGSVQYKWVANDIMNVNRTETPWLIFAGHRPAFTSSSMDETTSLFSSKMFDTYNPLFRKYKVDVALWAHMHKYERMCGLVDSGVCGERDEDGTVHIAIGNAGNQYQVPWTDDGHGHKNQPDWSIFRSSNFGYMKMSASRTELQLTLYGDQRDQVHDEIVLRK